MISMVYLIFFSNKYTGTIDFKRLIRAFYF